MKFGLGLQNFKGLGLVFREVNEVYIGIVEGFHGKGIWKSSGFWGFEFSR